MNFPRLVLSIVAVAVVLYVFDYVYHGIVLLDLYVENTVDVMRPQEDFMARQWLMAICYFLIGIGFCTTWAVGFAPHGHGVKCGIYYGVFIGLVYVAGMLIHVAVYQISEKVILPWILGGVVALVIAGILTALVYKPKASGGAPAAAG